MDNKRDPPPKAPAPDMSWSQASMEQLLALHSNQAGAQAPTMARSHPHRAPSATTTRPPSTSYPPQHMQNPGAVNLDLLATLAQNPGLTAPAYAGGGGEADFDRAFADALRVLGGSGAHPGAHPGSLPVPLNPYYGMLSARAMAAASHPPGAADAAHYWQHAPPGQGVASTSGGGGEERMRAMHAMMASMSAGQPPPAAPRAPGRARGNSTRQTSLPENSPTAAQMQEEDPEMTEQDEQALDEDKRRRNTAASARFRAKKKQQMTNLERTISEMSSREHELEKEAADLRRENGWLKEIVMLKGQAVSGAAGPSSSPGTSKDAGRR